MDKKVPWKFELPTIFIIFGITGDLVHKKILKSLYSLFLKGLLPKKIQVFGFSRRELDDAGLRGFLKDIMKDGKYKRPKEYDNFLSFFHYVRGDFTEREAYKNLANILGRVDGQWRVCSNKLFYLGVPPLYYRTILDELKISGLTIPCSPEEGWTRVILEKPFGTDLTSAMDLDSLLGSLFREEQIYRVDHYLAKETVRNILAFRFSNSFLTPSWNNKNIEKIEIKLLEKGGVGRRGEFYDKVGALRDVGQNHLLQLLSLFTMDNPGQFSAENIRKQRSAVLSKLRVFTSEEVTSHTVRGQYMGYKSEKGVRDDSETETYFKVKAYVDKDDFYGVPIYLESGKALNTAKTEITVTFRHKSPCLCPPGEHFQNVLIYTLTPEEKITTRFLVKKPGHAYILSPQNFEFDYQNKKTEFIEEYEQLLSDIITGDQTLFVSTDEILSQWKFVEPILSAWREGAPKLFFYPKDAKLDTGFSLDVHSDLEKEIGIVGLGKMGANLARNLLGKGWKVYGYNRTKEKTEELVKAGLKPAYLLKELVKYLHKPRILWIMLTAGEAVDAAIDELISVMEKGDIIVDAGNSYFRDSIRRGKKLEKLGIEFIDVGASGGPGGARNGMSLMVGGTKETYNSLKPLLKSISVPGGLAHFPGYGAGHFVKMVHNGIEYGMMQAIAEGFGIMKKSDYNLDLSEVARVYNNGSVIESRLVAWLENAFEIYGQDLNEVSGSVSYTGEGEWTVKTAREMKLKTPVIEKSFEFRVKSKENPSYMGKILSALRNQFGKHSIK